ncbi:MAG: hypothetical protein H9855_00075 [Candidatus Acinetobacter avistercoris]|uniref:hypothetical protein n=1 Tax=Acinetobacter sp. KS-LM10 TaxID=3120518 RepID=UPI001F925519|nr:hypothetical protein [Candidatus Acinetobacter avistercoris]
MDKYLIVAIVVLFCFIMVLYTQKSSTTQKNGSFIDTIKKAFPQYHVMEKNDSIIICEMNYRNEPDELIVIRVDPNQKKNFRSFGRRVTITYPKQPNLKEIKKDTQQYLNKS